jgi:hypothetical protein
LLLLPCAPRCSGRRLTEDLDEAEAFAQGLGPKGFKKAHAVCFWIFRLTHPMGSGATDMRRKNLVDDHVYEPASDGATADEAAQAPIVAPSAMAARMKRMREDREQEV